MATYKVIQDIEAEDKLLGPLTLRQFVYAAIVIVLGFIAYKLAAVSPLFVLPFLLPMAFFGLLAAPFGHDQSSEVWLLAKIRFLLKPRRRIWDQAGMKELVTITVPKKVERHLTDGLTQTEVKSRLHALANTIDSRGWAVKNVNVNLFSQPSYLTATTAGSDRLIDSAALPQEVPNYEVQAADDILDEQNNPTAQHLDAMIAQSEQAHRQTVLATVQNSGQPKPAQDDYWFMNQPTQAPSASPPGYASFGQNPVVQPGVSQPVAPIAPPSAAEQALLAQIHQEQTKPNPAYGHMKTLQPISNQPPANATRDNADDDKGQKTSSTSGNPAILRLANNDDLNVATIAREANKTRKQPPDDEVVISLR